MADLRAYTAAAVAEHERRQRARNAELVDEAARLMETRLGRLGLHGALHPDMIEIATPDTDAAWCRARIPLTADAHLLLTCSPDGMVAARVRPSDERGFDLNLDRETWPEVESMADVGARLEAIAQARREWQARHMPEVAADA